MVCLLGPPSAMYPIALWAHASPHRRLPHPRSNPPPCSLRERAPIRQGNRAIPPLDALLPSLPLPGLRPHPTPLLRGRLRRNGPLFLQLLDMAGQAGDIPGGLVREALVPAEGVREEAAGGAGQGSRGNGRGEVGVERLEVE